MEKGHLAFVATICLAVTIIYAAPAEDCPPNITSLFMANLDDCYTYYNCSYGEAKLVECPNGLQFNAKWRMCDSPETANCQIIAIECPTTERLYIPHPTDCTKFFECENGIPIEFSCPDGLAFNPETESCDWKDNVECDN